MTQTGQTVLFASKVMRYSGLDERYHYSAATGISNGSNGSALTLALTSPLACLRSIEPMEIDNQIAQALNRNRVFSFGSGISCLQ
jgi:hypothetical protein